MITVTLNAFLFLREVLDRKGVDCRNAPVTLPPGTTVSGLITHLGLEHGEVEAVFVNGKIVPEDTALYDGDRAGLVPPGTPGPHRFLLGIARRPGGEPPSLPTQEGRP
ncbi:MAG: MoaD/ThiS family protein [Candidatus Latescibacteria bacterium]|jgi:sulfur carrier protein ThiS|nr:MoaD/ThiS family protein [Candidatus Latescibacterota bacterium]